jgi:hypothetical protein
MYRFLPIRKIRSSRDIPMRERSGGSIVSLDGVSRS